MGHCSRKTTEKDGKRQAVPAVSAKFVQGQVAQALVVQQNGWTATNGQRGPGESHLQIPLECVPEWQSDYWYCIKPKVKRPKSNFKQTVLKSKKLVLCVPSVGIAPRYSRLYIVYIGPFFPTPCPQQLCPLVADSNLNCNASSRSAARKQAELSCNACSRSAARKQAELSDWTLAGRRNVQCHGRCRKLRARIWSGDETESKKQETRPCCLVVLPNNANLQAMIVLTEMIIESNWWVCRSLQ